MLDLIIIVAIIDEGIPCNNIAICLSRRINVPTCSGTSTLLEFVYGTLDVVSNRDITVSTSIVGMLVALDGRAGRGRKISAY